MTGAHADPPTAAVLAPTEEAALAKAKKTGDPVEVTAFRDERRTVYANPDQTFTAVQSVRAVRVRKGDGWATPDATLVKAKDGSLVPKAANLTMRFSGGGTGAVAKVERAGQNFSLAWPGRLPEPTIQGATATYADVLPGVDLVVNADIDGFSHVFKIKTREAAADPRVRRLTLTTGGSGGVRPVQGGGVRVVDRSGAPLLDAPQPLMWDSRKPAAETPKADAPGAVDLRKGPSESSRQGQAAVTLDRRNLTIAPDAALLSAKETTFPVYVDPVYKTASRTGWTMVASGYPSTEYWGFPGKDNEGSGKCPALSGDPYYCNGTGTKRLFYSIPTSAFKGKYIISAEFAVTLRHTYSSSAKGVDLHWTSKSIGTGTNWDNQPASGDMNFLQTKSPTNPTSSCTSTNQNVRFDAKAAVQAGLSNTTFRVRADDEGDYTYWKRFCENAQLEVHYTTAPNQPKQSELKMTPGGSCISGTGRPYVDEPPKLSATLRDPDNEQVRGQFSVSWVGTDGVKVTKTYTTGYKASGSRFDYSLTGVGIPQNTVISWEVRASDSYLWGPWSWEGSQTSCQFIYDATKPKPPTVTSTTGHAVGEYGSFTFKASDTDVVAYKYGFNDENVTAHTVQTTSGGAQTVRFMPDHDGPQSVAVVAVDGANQTNAVVANFEFYVDPGRGPRAAWDLNENAGATQAIARDLPDTTGTLSGSAQLGGAGTIGGSLALDGGSVQTGQKVVATDQNYSVSAWVKLTNSTQYGTVISQDGDRNSGFELGYYPSSGKWSFWRADADTDNAPIKTASGSAATLNTWTHLVGVYDKSAGQLRLYVNGSLAGTVAVTGDWAASGPLQIGRGKVNGAYAHWWRGGVDDVRIYDEPLSETDIADLYARKSAPPPALARWSLDEPAGTTQVTGVPERYTAGRVGTVQFGAPGVKGKALRTVGWESAGALETTAPVVRTDESFSVSAWVYLDKGDIGGYALGQDGASEGAFQLGYESALKKWAFRMRGTDTSTGAWINAFSTQPAELNEWVHLVGVHDATAKKIYLYVNGVLTGTADNPNPWHGEGALTIGRNKYHGQTSSYWHGYIDDVKVFDRVLVPDDIPVLYALSPERRGYWPLNTATGGISPEQRNGTGMTLTGDATIYTPPPDDDPLDPSPPAMVGSGQLRLNATGTDGAGTTPALIQTNRSFTVTLHARLASEEPVNSMTVLSQAGTSGYGFAIRYDKTTGQWQVVMPKTDGGSEVVSVNYTQAQGSSDESGQSIAIVYDHTVGELRIYVDGNEDAAAKVPYLSTWNAAGPLRIGGSGPEAFIGDVDDVRVYAGVLDEGTLQRLNDRTEQPDL
ncbi:LamG-like jellyroll fold domain-containing protein [Actinomadura rayongensis]|uniref:LamG-like jellyroll fold domain-containing protein n=1 Tax=Actinomadura rayongensis TaxID=1429076 RepID=A0A6I4WDD5_9ACTN|nr:hypothetical protein [Actinomadura rayongensis]